MRISCAHCEQGNQQSAEVTDLPHKERNLCDMTVCISHLTLVQSAYDESVEVITIDLIWINSPTVHINHHSY